VAKIVTNKYPKIPQLLSNIFHTISPGPVDAIAEFVDNSIQACMNEESCKISCQLFIPSAKVSSDSYLVVLDNGKGMDLSGIREFATYSRTQAKRGHAPLAGTMFGKMFIGKFGVGAKQAGFYLGDSITVLSKSMLDSSGKILRFCLNEVADVGSSATAAAIEETNPFQGVVEVLDQSEPMLPFSPDCSMPAYCEEMCNRIKRHFQEYQHGTVVVVKLLPVIVAAFRNDTAEELSKKLKDIYHFHLKQTVRFQDTANNAKFRQR
jgi:hypothetical protein